MKRPAAIFTIIQNEPVLFPLWYYYYVRYFDPSDIYVIDHDSVGDGLELLLQLQAEDGFHRIPVHREVSFDGLWLLHTVRTFQKFLLQSYDSVLFAEADEILAPVPGKGYADLAEYVQKFDDPFIAASGFEVVHKVDEEPALDFSQPLLAQRRWWYHTLMYSKTLLARVPVHWTEGFHTATNVPGYVSADPYLLLIHLHRIDYTHVRERHRLNNSQVWNPRDKIEGLSRQNRIEDQEMLSRWLLCNSDDTGSYAKLSLIPQVVKDAVVICSQRLPSV